MPSWRKVIISGSDAALNSLTVTSGVTGSLLGTASYATAALSASYALNGGVTQLLAGPNITLSPTNGLGQVTVSATLSGSTIFNTATGSYGSFYDTTTQTNPVANVPRSMSFNSTDITNGVSISGSTSPFNTYIKTTNAGIYNIQFSAQVEKTDSGTDEIVIWLRKNGIDLTDSATKLTLSGNSTKVVAAWNWFVSSAANDYYQIIWVSADTGMRLYAEPINDTPGIPSVILTVNRVDQFLSNTGSFSGSFTGVFTGSLLGTASYSSNSGLLGGSGSGDYVQILNNQTIYDTKTFYDPLVLGADYGLDMFGSTGKLIFNDQDFFNEGNTKISIGAGQIPVPPPSVSIDSGDLLFYNNSNNILAGLHQNGTGFRLLSGSFIGNLTGTASFAVSSSRAVSSSFASTASFLNNTTNAFIQGGNSFGTTALLGTNDNQNLALETSGSIRMLISSSGNVGIGTTSPVVALDFGNALDKAFHLHSNAGDYYGINMAQYDSGAYSTNILSGNGGAIKFRTASGTSIQSTRMTITSTGGVGIGTTNPYSPLQVGSYTGTGGYSYGIAATFVGGFNANRSTLFIGTTDIISTQDKGGSIDFGGGSEAGSTPYTFAKIRGFKEVSGGGYSGYLAFCTTPPGSDANTERMRINSSGNVGIGIISPSNRLHVGTPSSGDGIVIGSTAARYKSITWNNSTSPFDALVIESLGTSGTWRGTIDFKVSYNASSSFTAATIRANTDGTTANIGIGTTTPTTYSGYTTVAINNITNGGVLDFMRNGSVVGQIYNNSTSFNLLAIQGVPLILGSSGVEAMRIAPVTNNIYVKNILVAGGASTVENGRFYAGRQDGNLASLFSGNNVSQTTVPIFTARVDDSATGLGTYGYSLYNSSNVLKFSVDKNGAAYFSGSVGIGTTSPTTYSGYTTVAINNITNGGVLDFMRSGSVGGQIVNNSTAFYVLSIQNIPLILGTNGAERMRINSNGDVGIGTTSPNIPLGGALGLVIDGNTNGDIQIRLQSNSTGRTSSDGGLLSISGTTMYLWNYENDATIFGTNNTERMRIAANGNVGIGTTSLITYSGYNTLTIAGNTNGGVLAIRQPSSGSGLNIFGRSDGGVLAAIDATKSLFFQAGDIDRLSITSAAVITMIKDSNNYFRFNQTGNGELLLVGNPGIPGASTYMQITNTDGEGQAAFNTYNDGGFGVIQGVYGSSFNTSTGAFIQPSNAFIQFSTSGSGTGNIAFSNELDFWKGTSNAATKIINIANTEAVRFVSTQRGIVVPSVDPNSIATAEEGEIVYDPSTDTFYGYTFSNGWVKLG